MGRCLAKDPGDRPDVAHILEELTNPIRTTAPWLPPPNTTMFTERAAQTPHFPIHPGTPHGRTLRDTADGQHDHPAWRPGNQPTLVAERGSDTPQQNRSGTVTAAIVLALLCLPEMLGLIVKTAGFLHELGAPTGLLWVNMVIGGVEVILIATGALLLSQHKMAGRRIIAATGPVVALHSMSFFAQASMAGASVTMDGPFGVFFVFAPLTAVLAVAAMIMALHPATGSWCLRRS